MMFVVRVNATVAEMKGKTLLLLIFSLPVSVASLNAAMTEVPDMDVKTRSAKKRSCGKKNLWKLTKE
jgi:hypothetical protein